MHNPVVTVDTVDDDDTRPLFGEERMEDGGVVMGEAKRRGAARQHAVPERGVGAGVDVNAGAGPGDRLQEAEVCAVPRLGQHDVGGAEVPGEAVFEQALRRVFAEKYGRHPQRIGVPRRGDENGSRDFPDGWRLPGSHC